MLIESRETNVQLFKFLRYPAEGLCTRFLSIELRL